eukprot:763557-Hanusia_phi.AAC.2
MYGSASRCLPSRFNCAKVRSHESSSSMVDPPPAMPSLSGRKMLLVTGVALPELIGLERPECCGVRPKDMVMGASNDCATDLNDSLRRERSHVQPCSLHS